MRLLRRISTRQLIALTATIIAVAAGATAIAMAASNGGPKPDPKPLPVAVHDALTAPELKGVSARIQFTNHLIDSSSVQGKDPILTGASGRLWASNDGHLRLELQGSGNGGATSDTQVLADRKQVTVYDSGTNTVYRADLPAGDDATDQTKSDGPPSLAQVRKAISRAMEHANLSGATPSDVAGQPAYTVRITPKHDGGLLGGAEVAWDAIHGSPLRAAIYASGDSSPVIELKVTDISYGPVSSSVFDVTPPADAKVTNLSPASHGGADHKGEAPVTGLNAVQQQTSFQIAAPQTLAGLPKNEVRLIQTGNDAGALVTYGQGLGGIAVLEQPADAKSATSAGGDQGQLQLPKVRINGVQGDELDTALGTLLRFQRGGVQYTVVGSVPPAAAEAAARDL